MGQGLGLGCWAGSQILFALIFVSVAQWPGNKGQMVAGAGEGKGGSRGGDVVIPRTLSLDIR